MNEREIDHDMILHMLMEIERRQKLTAIMIGIFGLCWAFSKVFPSLYMSLGG